MYNGIGLQTPRGSGTNGYVQTNKFLIRGRTSKVVVDEKGFGPDQGMGGISKKANREILEHDRKRQIELKLVILEDKLSEQGYTDAEIAEKCEELRRKLEAEAAVSGDGEGGAVVGSDKKVSDTETHQIAARKEKQMEKLRDALGISITDDATMLGNTNDIGNDNNEREEGEILHDDEDVKTMNHYQDGDKSRIQGRKTKKEDNKKKHDSESSDSESTEESNGSDTDSDQKTKGKQRSTKLSKKKITDDSDSDDSYRGRQKDVGRSSKVPKRHDPSSESDQSDRSVGHRTRKSKQHLTSSQSRHNSGNEHGTEPHKRRAISDKEMIPTGSKNNDGYGGRHDDKYYKSSDTSGQVTKPAMTEPVRSKRYDTDEDVDSDHEVKMGKSLRRGRHDSEDDDSGLETNELVKEKEKHQRTHNKVEDEHGSGKLDKLEVEDGNKKRERRTGGDHVHRRHENRGEGSQAGKKQERNEDIEQERTKWEKKVQDDGRGKDIDEDDFDRKRMEREEKDVYERKGRERRDDDEIRKRKLEERKDEVDLSRKEHREEDEYRSKKREKREGSDLGGRKRESREEDGKQGRNWERREEDEHVSKKRGRGEEEQEDRKRVRQEEDDRGGKYQETREQEKNYRNERKEQDRYECKNRDRMEEEDRGRRRHDKEDDSPRKHETRRRDDVRRRH